MRSNIDKTVIIKTIRAGVLFTIFVSFVFLMLKRQFLLFMRANEKAHSLTIKTGEWREMREQ